MAQGQIDDMGKGHGIIIWHIEKYLTSQSYSVGIHWKTELKTIKLNMSHKPKKVIRKFSQNRTPPNYYDFLQSS